jgi:hypothetical protein
MIHLFISLLLLISPPKPQGDRDSVDPVEAILEAIESYRIVAIGENHGHAELHELILEVLQSERASLALDDVIVEWGNALYQPLIDRYISGESVPADSVAMAWRNTVVSPNTVWDAAVYSNFFERIREINNKLPAEQKYRVLLADSPIDWDQVKTREDVQPFFDRAANMADVVRTNSLLKDRTSLFLAGGLHVSKRSRTHSNRLGIPFSEITPVAWIEIKNPGVTFVIQSFGKAANLGLEELTTSGSAKYFDLQPGTPLALIAATSTSSLKNRDGSKPDVYPGLTLGEIVDAVIVWDPNDVTFVEPPTATYDDGPYWEELNRRSQIMRGEPMDPSIRDR